MKEVVAAVGVNSQSGIIFTLLGAAGDELAEDKPAPPPLARASNKIGIGIDLQQELKEI